MARPKKKTLDYFEVDVGIVQNLKVRKLINRKGGARALGVFVYLLCRIYKNGYHVDCNPDAIFEVAADLCEQENYVMEVILYCLEIGLFDQSMYDRHQILTSRSIQERYVALQVQRKRITVVEQYDLLYEDDPMNGVSSEETRVSSEETLKKQHLFGGNCTNGDVSSEEMGEQCSEEMHDKGHNFGINAEEKVVSSEETHITSEETPENGNLFGRNPQETTVLQKKETKEKVPKKKNNKKNPPPSTTTPAREERVFDEENFQKEGLKAEIVLLASDSIWADSIFAKFGLQADALAKTLEAFKTDCLARGKLQHVSIEDVKSHFADWLRIQIENQNNKTTDYARPRQRPQGNTSSSADLRRAAAVPNDARQEDFGGTF